MSGPAGRSPRVAVIGAGVSGLCMGHRLKSAGIDDFVIYERAPAVGGVWRDNIYPGLNCDLPSRNYAYSFAPNAEWTQFYSDGQEIRRYLNHVADTCGLREHIRLGEEVTTATFADGQWTLETALGATESFDFLLCATGLLVHPKVPQIPGLDEFAGAAFHSSRWDHTVPLAGRRIAVIGTGSTGVQLTCALAETAGRFMLFQRTPQWVFPKVNKRYSAWAKAAHRRIPGFSRLADHAWRLAYEHTIGAALVKPGLRRALFGLGCRLALRSVRSAPLRRKLTPDYQPMCKRIVTASGFYRAVQLPHVDVVTEAIEKITPTSILTADGQEHPVDVIILATGYHADAYTRPMKVTGQDGITLDAAWAEGPRAYRTVAVPHFPNLFLLCGPNSPYANEPVLRTAETQADYIMQWISLFREGKISQAAPTREATDSYNAAINRALPRTVFAAGCASWYQDVHGVPVIWPWTVSKHRKMLAAIRSDDFDTRPGPAHPHVDRPLQMENP
ncbi:flavin-containing monooxygenase [Streptomyces sp. NPDC048387]|uniref:flavin-containing monooxygenase n=1 Tax=Streptomyces sp. NPDC048387 TaxID=3365542 RepID=UPI003720C23D